MDIEERIKKLLRRAACEGSSAGEIAAAMRAATRLAKAHGLDLESIDPDDDNHAGVGHSTAKCKALGDAEEWAIRLVSQQFPVQPIRDRRGDVPVVHFIGSPAITKVAEYAFVYLVRVMRRAWSECRDRRIKRPAFLAGFALAITEHMGAAFQMRTESLVPQFDSYIAETFGATVTTKPAASTPSGDGSMARGYRAGQRAGIRGALNAAEHPKLSSN